MKGLPKLGHYWSLTIRLFSVINRTLVGESYYFCVYSVAYIYIYIYIPSPLHDKEVRQGKFLSEAEQIWIQSFSSLAVAIPRLNCPVCPTIYLWLVAYFYKGHWCNVEWRQLRPEFKLGSLYPIPTTIMNYWFILIAYKTVWYYTMGFQRWFMLIAICLHSGLFYSYPTLSCWFNFLDMRAVKE